MEWQPIETAPRTNDQFLFWIVPRPPDECYTDSSGRPIVGKFKPFVKMCGYREWSALSKATYWMPLPSPPTVDEGTSSDARLTDSESGKA